MISLLAMYGICLGGLNLFTLGIIAYLKFKKD